MQSLTRTFIAVALNLIAWTGAASAADFSFERLFAGRTVAEGSFSAINGVKRTFDVDLTGRWNGKVLTLREDFRFSDGERDTKTWRFTKTGPKSYVGTREDVIGKVPVAVDGKTARFTYVVYLDKERTNKVRFHDTMTIQPDGGIRNVALVTKFGFPVAITRVNFKRK